MVFYHFSPDNQVKVSIAVFVAEFAATTMKQTFVVAVSTGNLGSISVNASSAVIVQQGKDLFIKDDYHFLSLRLLCCSLQR